MREHRVDDEAMQKVGARILAAFGKIADCPVNPSHRVVIYERDGDLIAYCRWCYTTVASLSELLQSLLTPTPHAAVGHTTKEGR